MGTASGNLWVPGTYRFPDTWYLKVSRYLVPIGFTFSADISDRPRT